MRKGKLPPLPESEDYGDAGVGFVDWKEPPDQVLDMIDYLLKPHGLEVVMLDSGGDSYAFKVEVIASGEEVS